MAAPHNRPALSVVGRASEDEREEVFAHRLDLFVSHSSNDVQFARQLTEILEAKGLLCWLGPRDVPIGGAYQIEIVNALEACRGVVLIFSGAANASEHVLREIELATQGKKPIFPIRLQEAQAAGGLKYLLANTQWIDGRGDIATAADAIATELKRAARASVSPQPSAPNEAQRPSNVRPVTPVLERVEQRRRSAMPAVVAGLLLLLAGGAGLWTIFDARQPATSVPAAAPQTTPERVAAAPAAATQPADATPAPSAPSSEPAPAPSSEPPPSQPPSSGPPSQPSSSPSVPATLPTVTPASLPAPSDVVHASAPKDPRALGRVIHLFTDCTGCPVMAVIPAGQASIGSPEHELGRGPEEGPLQRVAFQGPFAIGRTEVSFEQWMMCVAEGGCNAYRPGDYGWGYGTRPAINVSWNDAQAYVEWLSGKTGARYRLPSEAEWEYAARACPSGQCGQTAFSFGSDITPQRANYDWRYSYNGSPKAQPPRRTIAVDGGETTPYGLQHVHGNVREWVADCWNASLTGLPADGSARKTGDCKSRVVRGGAWSDEPKNVRTAKRSWEVPGERRAQIGFRVARALGP